MIQPARKSLLLCAIHIALLAAVGGKFLADRSTLPRVWVRALPYDPNLPIRGRYVRLRLEVPPGQTVQLGSAFTAPVAFFIPEHAADPSRRPAGEELWAEVTVPKKGSARPIRLGVKKNGVLTPLALD
jgi:hypothetical protein